MLAAHLSPWQRTCHRGYYTGSKSHVRFAADAALSPAPSAVSNKSSQPSLSRTSTFSRMSSSLRGFARLLSTRKSSRINFEWNFEPALQAQQEEAAREAARESAAANGVDVGVDQGVDQAGERLGNGEPEDVPVEESPFSKDHADSPFAEDHSDGEHEGPPRMDKEAAAAHKEAHVALTNGAAPVNGGA